MVAIEPGASGVNRKFAPFIMAEIATAGAAGGGGGGGGVGARGDRQRHRYGYAAGNPGIHGHGRLISARRELLRADVDEHAARIQSGGGVERDPSGAALIRHRGGPGHQTAPFVPHRDIARRLRSRAARDGRKLQARAENRELREGIGTAVVEELAVGVGVHRREAGNRRAGRRHGLRAQRAEEYVLADDAAFRRRTKPHEGRELRALDQPGVGVHNFVDHHGGAARGRYFAGGIERQHAGIEGAGLQDELAAGPVGVGGHYAGKEQRVAAGRVLPHRLRPAQIAGGGRLRGVRASDEIRHEEARAGRDAAVADHEPRAHVVAGGLCLEGAGEVLRQPRGGEARTRG